MNFDVIALAGLTQEEFASIAGVSRATVNTWVGGHFEPHHFIRRFIEELLVQIEAALHAGRLPLDKALHKGQRVAAARTAIQLQVAPIDAAIAASKARVDNL